MNNICFSMPDSFFAVCDGITGGGSPISVSANWNIYSEVSYSLRKVAGKVGEGNQINFRTKLR